MSSCFDKVKKNFGFGCMRLPMNGENVDTAEFSRMVDYFLENGFNYFDTAHGYLDGKSETALRECLTSRYPREQYILTNKLSPMHFQKQEDIHPLFEQQLAACGVSYFDFYLMHTQHRGNYPKYKACRAYETAFELKAEGKVKHIGISFHDNAEMLERILTDYPQIETVQLQFNYIDYDDTGVESRKCYEVCRRHGKPVIVMEPVKGGSLVNLPPEARAIFDGLNGGSYASYAIRFAAGFEGIAMVLSGMGNMDMMRDNVSYMKEFQPLNQWEAAAVERVRDILLSENRIPCTDCRYCMEVCPRQIRIPTAFACMNERAAFDGWGAKFYYDIQTRDGGKAGDCIQCGCCEEACPQHLPIRELLKTVAAAFEKEENDE